MIKGIIFIVLSFFCIKERERIVGITGKFAWAERYLGLGGSYNLIVLIGVFLFFWGVANLTGTTDVFLSPLRRVFFPGAPTGEEVPAFDSTAF